MSTNVLILACLFAALMCAASAIGLAFAYVNGVPGIERAFAFQVYLIALLLTFYALFLSRNAPV